MARLRRWSVASAWISLLAIATVAQAETNRSIELPVAVPVEVTVPGIEQVVSADPAVVKAEMDTTRGVVVLTGLALARQGVVYAWTASDLVVFVARVVSPRETGPARTPVMVSADGRPALYQLNVGSGFQDSPQGFRRLPFSFGATGSRPMGTGGLSFRGNTRPFAEDNPTQEASGSGVFEWKSDSIRAAIGDQPIDVAPHLGQSFPLRGVTATTSLGPVAVTVFGGTRATPKLQLLPDDDDHDPLPSMLGGIKAAWNVAPKLKVTGTFAMAEGSPIASLATDWTPGGFSIGAELAGTSERLGGALRLRREMEQVTVDQRFFYRTAGVSALLPGTEGLVSETGMTWKISPEVTALARVSAMPPLGPVPDWKGGVHVGGRYDPQPTLRLALGVDRSFDGATTSVGGGVDFESKVFGNVSVTASRTLESNGSERRELWQQGIRAEKEVAIGSIRRFFIEETLHRGPMQGSLTMVAGAEAEVGWLRASVAPGAVIPTVTDPNGVQKMIRLRLSASPTPALQVQAELRQTFGKRPDTTVQVGVGVGVGSGMWNALTSWFTTSSVDGVVFVDQNGNGRYDRGERGLAGVRIGLGDGRSVVTDADGKYRLTGLKRGTHTVAIDRSALTSDLRLASASQVAVTVPGGPREVSFAFAGAGAIHGVVFNDVALRGRFHGTEPGVAADLVLEGPGGRRTLSVAGSFSVGGLAPGRYRIAVDPLSLPPAYVVDTPEVEIELGPGQVLTAQFPVVALRAIQVTVCMARGYGACAPGDPRAAGVKVVAARVSATTDATGRALLRQLPAGRVMLSVDPATLPAGWAAPAPVTVELPEAATTVPVPIRLTPSTR